MPKRRGQFYCPRPGFLMADTKHLIIFQKTYDLLKEVYRDCNNFPKSQRFILGQRIENTVTNLLEKMIVANNAQEKEPVLLEVNTELEKLRIFLRLAKDLAFLPFKRYNFCAKKVDEIGRMLGGWIKASQRV